MIGHSKTLVIWFLFILQNITCSPVTILLSEKDRQCFYIEVEEKTEYTAKVVLLSGGSVGFSEYGPREYEDNRLVRPRKIDEHKIEMIPVLSDYDDDTADGDGNGADHNSRTLNKFGNPSGPFKHTFESSKNGEHEICLFSDRRFGREAKHVILDIAKKTEGTQTTLGDKHSQEPRVGSDPAEGPGHIRERIHSVETSIERLTTKQEKKANRRTRREQAAKDYHYSMERNSLMETVVLVVVSVVQIIFVRRWFQGKGTLLKQWA